MRNEWQRAIEDGLGESELTMYVVSTYPLKAED